MPSIDASPPDSSPLDDPRPDEAMARVVVLGATGYVGARLVPRLAAAGHPVLGVARSVEAIQRWSWSEHPWGDRVEAAAVDLIDDDLATVLRPGDVVVHLVHSLVAAGFEDVDHDIAEAVARAAERAGASRIVYLGGLGDTGDPTSEHLGSRHDVGEVLRKGSTPVTELRAALLLGSGSASFEMLRTIAELFPVLPVPASVRTTRCQPIAIDDALSDLEWAITAPEAHGVVDIGGADVLTYEEIIQTYATVAGLTRRRFVTVPYLNDSLVSFALNLVAPLPAPLVRHLVASVGVEVVVDRQRSIERFGLSRARSTTADAIRAALDADADPSSHWTDDLARTTPAALLPSDDEWAGQTIFVDARRASTERSAAEVFRSVAAIGGPRGWLAAPLLWEVRGWIDRLVPGGVGLRRGRRHPLELRLDDVVDWWRVEDIATDERLLLRAEMRAPGDAWLEWRIDDEGDERIVSQRAVFRPNGIAGRLYWYALLPFHGYLFPRLLERIIAGVGLVHAVEEDIQIRDLRQLDSQDFSDSDVSDGDTAGTTTS